MFNELSLKNKFRYAVLGKAKAYGMELLSEMNTKDPNRQKMLILIEHGADLRLVNKFDDTALIGAARLGYVDVIKKLVEADADIHESSRHTRTPLANAAMFGHLDAVQELVALGADVQGEEGVDAMIGAAMREGGFTIIDALITLGADVHACNYRGETPLMSAAGCGRLDTVKELVALGVDIHAKDCRSETAFSMARFYSRMDVVTYLENYSQKLQSSPQQTPQPQNQKQTAAKKAICTAIDKGLTAPLPRKYFGGFKRQGGVK